MCNSHWVVELREGDRRFGGLKPVHRDGWWALDIQCESLFLLLDDVGGSFQWPLEGQ